MAFSYDISTTGDNRETVYVRWGTGITDSTVTHCGWNIDDVWFGGTPVSPGDLDGDGGVSLADLASLLAVYGTTCD